MKVIIAWDGDHIGREVGRASLADDVDGLRRISQSIDLGNRIWASWVTMNGGSIISFGGDEGRAEILAEKLAELPKVRDQYATAVQSSVSVGVGTKLSEADRALLCAKLRGGDRIVLYTPEIEQEIEASQKKDRSEADKLADEYLNKAEGQAEGPAPTAPTQDAQVAQDRQADAPPPPKQEQPSKSSLEDTIHQFAQQDQQGQQQAQAAAGTGNEQLKSQLVQILQALKAQAPVLEQVKQTAPDTYEAVMGLTQMVIMMAKQMNGDPQGTTQGEIEDRARSQAQVQVPLPPEDGEESSSKDEKSDTKKSEKPILRPAFHLKPSNRTFVMQSGWHDPDELAQQFKPTGDSWHPDPNDGWIEGYADDAGKFYSREQANTHVGGEEGKNLESRAYERGVKSGIYKSDDEDWVDCDEHGHTYGVGPTGDHCLMCGKDKKTIDEEALDKASLVANKAPAQHHHLNLPVGSKVDPGPEEGRYVGRIKVQHVEDGQAGKQGWVQARAGQVMSQDGHPISARNPGGK